MTQGRGEGGAADTSDSIRIEGLRKEYTGGDGVHGLDLTIPRGCTFGLLGPNGAGKSTTIKMLMGLITPTAGEAFVHGYSIRSDAERIRACVGYVPERHHIYPWMTIKETIWFTRAFCPAWDQAMCDLLLEQYGLHPSKKVKELSHGMTTKLALALALSHDPEVLLLDEPTTGLDPLIREEFLDGITQLLRVRSRTVLFSSHILSDIEKVADRIGTINKGKLLMCAPQRELVANTKRVAVTLKKDHRPTVTPLGTVLDEMLDERWNLTVHGFSGDTLKSLAQQNDVARCDVEDMSLEEIFKDFIKGARK